MSPLTSLIVNIRVMIRVRFKVWFRVRVGLELHLGLGCCSLYQYSGVQMEIFPSEYS